MTARFRITGGLLARNTVISLVGQVLPLGVAFVAMPFVVRGLGADRFGILGIAWMLLGYFTELGFGRATTKFVAEHLGAGERRRLPGIVWTTVAIQTGIGALIGLALAAATPLLATRVLEVPAALHAETRTAFFLLAAVLPAIVTGSSFRGALQAAQRHDLSTAVRVPASMANFVLPLVGLALGWRLPGILALLLLSRFFALIGYFALARRIFPELRGWPTFDRGAVRAIVDYGGWSSVSSIISPVLLYLDRFMLGALVAVSAVGYYTAPYELVTRLWIIPISLVTTLFPAFSTLSGRAAWDRVERIAARAVKYVLCMIGPIVVLIAAGAEDILRLWLGGDFARQSTLALQILAAGVLINSIAFVPHSLLHGLGRPDVTAKFHLLELPVQVALIALIVPAWGIPGAAAAWTARVTVDAVLLFGAMDRLSSFSLRSLYGQRVPQTMLAFFGFTGIGLAASALPSLWARGAAVAAVGLAAAVVVWAYSLGENGRADVRRVLLAAMPR